MRNATTPLAVPSDDYRSATDLLTRRVALDPQHVLFARRRAGILEDVTAAEFERQARTLAAGLIAQGVEPHQRVVVMSPTRYEWAVAEMAIWFAGAVVVPIYDTSAPTQVARIIEEVQPRLAVVADESRRQTVASVAPDLSLWTMDPSPRDLMALVASGREEHFGLLEDRHTQVSASDVATIVYTSGTTARQKGVLISHSNLTSLVLNVAHDYAELVHDRAVTVVALPLAHILARGLQLIAVAAGMKVVHESEPSRIIATLAEVRPTFMVVVPRLLEKIRAAARNAAQDKKLGALFRLAEATAVQWAQHLEAKQDDPQLRASIGLRLRHWAFDKLFYRRLRKLLGGRIEWFLSGAAPLDPTLARFFWGIGINVIEGYGLTETTAPAAGTRPGDLRPGCVGPPMPGTEIRIADDGEVLVRGIGVSSGYSNPQDDEEAFSEGYFRTGDLGTLDERGRLRIVGRSKAQIVTATGKTVTPQPWEDAVMRSPLVAQAVMVGDGKPYLSAMLLLDVEAAIRWAREEGLAQLAAQLGSVPPPEGIIIDDLTLQQRLQRSIDRANATVSKAEQVRRFVVLLADLNVGSPYVTPTLKLRREAFLTGTEKHHAILYPSAEKK